MALEFDFLLCVMRYVFILSRYFSTLLFWVLSLGWYLLLPTRQGFYIRTDFLENQLFIQFFCGTFPHFVQFFIWICTKFCHLLSLLVFFVCPAFLPSFTYFLNFSSQSLIAFLSEFFSLNFLSAIIFHFCNFFNVIFPL